MKKFLFLIWMLIITLNSIGQDVNQQTFVDSFNKAIGNYQDFLVKLVNGKSSFEKGKALFINAGKQLEELRLDENFTIDNTLYEQFKGGIETMKSKNFASFIATEKKLKGKKRILVNGKATLLSIDNGIPLAIVLEILKRKLNDFINANN